jgi:hypothetical protein
MEESQSMCQKAGEPKKLVILPGLGHSDIIAGPGVMSGVWWKKEKGVIIRAVHH